MIKTGESESIRKELGMASFFYWSEGPKRNLQSLNRISQTFYEN